MVLGALDIFAFRVGPGAVVEEAPFLVTVLVKGVVYGLVIVIVQFGQFGDRLVGASATGPDPSILRHVFFSVAITMAFIFVMQISLLVGGRNLRNLLIGRYHSPRVEERFFLFVDVRGSTAIAERLGPTGVHRFLNDVFALAADPVDELRGEVHQYVGDEMVVTWPVATGRVHARAAACFFAIERALEGAAPAFERTFGVVPRIRAALHAGDVIVGEVGVRKREIVFHGDVMNTASRLEHLAGELEHRLLASEDAVNRLDALEPYALKDVGTCSLRGRQQGIRVYAIEPIGDTMSGGGAEPAMTLGQRAREAR